MEDIKILDKDEYVKKIHTVIDKKKFPYADIVANQAIGYVNECKYGFQCGRVKCECTNPKNESKFCLFGWYSGDRISDHLCYNFEPNPNWKSISNNYFYNRKATMKHLEETGVVSIQSDVASKFYEHDNVLDEMLYKPYGVVLIGTDKVDNVKLIEDNPYLRQTPVNKMVIHVPIIEDDYELYEYIHTKIVNNINFMFIPNVKLKSEECSDEYFRKVYTIFTDVENSLIMDLTTRINNSREIQTNEIMNLSWINHAYWGYDFKDKAKDKNILCVSGGPSLNENIEWIKQNKDKFIIFCATTVAELLLKNDIVPDVIGQIDMKGFNKLYLDAIKDYDLSKTHLLFEVDGNYNTINSYESEKIIMIADINNMPYIRDKFTDETFEFAKHGTVAGMIYSFACLCNPKAIYMIGYDLCYYNGLTHAKGTKFCNQIEILEQNGNYFMNDMKGSVYILEKTKNNLGEDVYTTEQFKNYLQSLEEASRKHNVPTYDLGSKSIKKECIPYKDINTVLIEDTSNFSDVISTLSKKKYKNKFVKELIMEPVEEKSKEVIENQYVVYTYLVNQIQGNEYLNYNDLCKKIYDKLLEKGLTEIKKYAIMSLEMFEKRNKEEYKKGK